MKTARIFLSLTWLIKRLGEVTFFRPDGFLCIGRQPCYVLSAPLLGLSRWDKEEEEKKMPLMGRGDSGCFPIIIPSQWSARMEKIEERKRGKKKNSPRWRGGRFSYVHEVTCTNPTFPSISTRWAGERKEKREEEKSVSLSRGSSRRLIFLPPGLEQGGAAE